MDEMKEAICSSWKKEARQIYIYVCEFRQAVNVSQNITLVRNTGRVNISNFAKFNSVLIQ